MYSLNCSYYTKQFPTLNELINDIMISGMDPNYEITRNGEGIGEEAIDYITFQPRLQNEIYYIYRKLKQNNMYNFDPTQKPPVLVSILIIVGVIVGIAYAVAELVEQLNK